MDAAGKTAGDRKIVKLAETPAPPAGRPGRGGLERRVLRGLLYLMTATFVAANVVDGPYTTLGGYALVCVAVGLAGLACSARD